jgi:hypothetical protein
MLLFRLCTGLFDQDIFAGGSCCAWQMYSTDEIHLESTPPILTLFKGQDGINKENP